MEDEAKVTKGNYQIGSIVKINASKSSHHNKIGTIVEKHSIHSNACYVLLEEGLKVAVYFNSLRFHNFIPLIDTLLNKLDHLAIKYEGSKGNS